MRDIRIALGSVAPTVVRASLAEAAIRGRALTHETIAAGCDAALHCSGEMAEMQKIAAVVPALSKAALARLKRAQALGPLKADDASTVKRHQTRLEHLLARAN